MYLISIGISLTFMAMGLAIVLAYVTREFLNR